MTNHLSASVLFLPLLICPCLSLSLLPFSPSLSLPLPVSLPLSLPLSFVREVGSDMDSNMRVINNSDNHINLWTVWTSLYLTQVDRMCWCCRTPCGTWRSGQTALRAWSLPTMYRNEGRSSCMPCREYADHCPVFLLTELTVNWVDCQLSWLTTESLTTE